MKIIWTSPWFLASQWRSSIFLNGKVTDSKKSLNTKLTRRNRYMDLLNWEVIVPISDGGCHQPFALTARRSTQQQRKKWITESYGKHDSMCRHGLWLQEDLGKITEAFAQNPEFLWNQDLTALTKDSSYSRISENYTGPVTKQRLAMEEL